MIKTFPKYSVYILIVLSALPFLLPFTNTSLRGGFSSTYANVSGLLGALLMFWQLILSNRFIAKKISPDYFPMVGIHKTLGIYGFFFIASHPILEILSYGQKVLYLVTPTLVSTFETHVTYGRFALYLYFFVWISSALIRGKINYRLWRYVHYLTFLLMFFVILHANSIGTFLNTYLLLKAYWFLLIFIYLIFIALRFTQWLNFGRATYTLINKTKLAKDITTYKVSPKGKVIMPKIGQFCFIRINETGESHPFTVMDFDEGSGQMTFGVKAVGKFTKQLESLSIEQEIYIDGPYGKFTSEGQSLEPKVIIAGGIGVTPFVNLVNKFSGDNSFMVFANKYLGEAIHRDNFKKKLKQNYIDIISREHVVGERMVSGHISKDVLLKFLPKEIVNTANFFVCGNGGFMETSIEALKAIGVPKNRIFAEEFSI